jgi:hypothetical protein
MKSAGPPLPNDRREVNRENRRLLAAALERIPELEPPRETFSETQRSSETAAEGAGSTVSPAPEQQRSSPRVSWWRRFFGFD